MIKIQLQNIGKKYNYEWIFRKIDYDFISGNHYAIMGANGSGKSTLLKVISGNTLATEGRINYTIQNKDVEPDTIFSNISIAAPYLDLFEEFNLKEAVSFQNKFKSFQLNMNCNDVINIMELSKSENKTLKYFSSGMKQRVKLALAIMAETPLLFLDEPCSNLDKNAISWYQKLINTFCKNRIVIVCSNQIEDEYNFCNKLIKIEDYK